ncbi:MAG: hypothetical protein Q8K40_05270, partial [Ignavibacteria bacterium]|nr:hypothetical protein [Ignavibacteria bacterium]
MEEMGIAPSAYADHIYFDLGFWSVCPEVWYLDCNPADYNNAAVYKLRKSDVEAEGAMVMAAIQDLAETAREAGQEKALCVSHGGPLDAAVMVAKSSLGKRLPISDLGEGEGAIFTFEDDKLVSVEDFLHKS